MYYTDNPIADFHRHDAEQEERHKAYLARLPKCEYCKKPIDEDTCLDVVGEYYHEDCFIKHHRKSVDEIVE